MVLWLYTSSAGATLLESSSLASTHSVVASPPTIHAPNSVFNSRLLSLSSKISWYQCSFWNCKLNNRSKFLYKLQAEIAQRDPVSISSFDIFELVRRRPRSAANAIVSDGASKKELQSDHLHPLDPYQLPLRKWKHNLWHHLGTSSSSFDAPPQTPVPPFTGGLISLLGLVLICGHILDKWIWRSRSKTQTMNARKVQSESLNSQLSSTAISMFLQRDIKTKESVEWVNMVLGKLWKVYRIGMENWLVGLLQPLIDNLNKPLYVERVQIKHFYLGDEPIAVRSVQRRASRRSNDLQYHVGLRYTGGARMLLSLNLKAGFLPITVPVGVRNLDVDGELWVKLRLVPAQPWVGATTWAFVSLPKIKLDLAAFRLFNVMAIPFLSVFLTKLLTVDLPQLFVLPKRVSINFLNGRPAGTVPKDFKGTKSEGNQDFSGELSVTLVDAKKLIYVPYGKPDPYVVLILGDQLKTSKRNSQTSFYGPPGSPTWNQDFRFLVVDSKSECLKVRVRDYFGFTAVTFGVAEVDLSSLQDTVPVDRVVRLRGSWGLFEKRDVGELLLRLTYTAYVEEDEDFEEKCEGPPDSSTIGLLTEADENDTDAVPLLKEVVKKAVETAESETSMPNVLAAVIAELDKGNTPDCMTSEGSSNGVKWESDSRTNNSKGGVRAVDEMERSEIRIGLLWLALVTGLLLLVDRSVDFTNFMNP